MILISIFNCFRQSNYWRRNVKTKRESCIHSNWTSPTKNPLTKRTILWRTICPFVSANNRGLTPSSTMQVNVFWIFQFVSTFRICCPKIGTQGFSVMLIPYISIQYVWRHVWSNFTTMFYHPFYYDLLWSWFTNVQCKFLKRQNVNMMLTFCNNTSTKINFFVFLDIIFTFYILLK